MTNAAQPIAVAVRYNIPRFMRRSLLNCFSPLEADVIGTLISCQAWKLLFGHLSRRRPRLLIRLRPLRGRRPVSDFRSGTLVLTEVGRRAAPRIGRRSENRQLNDRTGRREASRECCRTPRLRPPP